VAFGCGLWLWPLAVAFGCGLWLWPLAVALWPWSARHLFFDD